MQISFSAQRTPRAPAWQPDRRLWRPILLLSRQCKIHMDRLANRDQQRIVTSGNHSSRAAGPTEDEPPAQPAQTDFDRPDWRTDSSSAHASRHGAVPQPTHDRHRPNHQIDSRARCGTPAVVEIRRRKVMPGTRARRAREYRARSPLARTHGQRPPPTVSSARTGRRKVLEGIL
jgi:hypothetical protein